MSTNSAAILLWGGAAAASVLMAVPNMLAFGSSLARGLRLIDWLYPWPQNHGAFKSNAPLIRAHILGNGLALLTGTALVYPGSWPPTSGTYRAAFPLFVGSLLGVRIVYWLNRSSRRSDLRTLACAGLGGCHRFLAPK